MNGNQEKLEQIFYIYQNFTMLSSFKKILCHFLRMFLHKILNPSILIAQTNSLLGSVFPWRDIFGGLGPFF